MDNKKYRELVTLVNLGEESQLKRELNKGIAWLPAAPKSWFRPHLCLNGEEGVAVIEKIIAHPEQANTEFSINDKVTLSGEDIWLNISFMVFLDKISSQSILRLSPRQTAYIIKQLPKEQQDHVLGKIKTWYEAVFLENIAKGLKTITAQFEVNPLVESDYRNRILDIHGDVDTEFPYTEAGIIGEKFFLQFLYFLALPSHGRDGYKQVDEFFSQKNKHSFRF